MSKPRVILHRLPGTKRAVEVCRLVESLYLDGKRAVVFMEDAGRASVLDAMLWTFSQNSFVPHVYCQGAESAQEPVVLVSGTVSNPNRSTVLVVGDRLPDLDQAAPFGEIHDFIGATPEDAARCSAWEASGYEVVPSRRGSGSA
jgi:DNA polymerase-3 subunit chi